MKTVDIDVGVNIEDKDASDKDEATWPLPREGGPRPMRNVSFQFFDGGTRAVGEHSWEDIPGFTFYDAKDLTLLWDETREIFSPNAAQGNPDDNLGWGRYARSAQRPPDVAPRRQTIKIWGNASSKVPDSVIAEEYDIGDESKKDIIWNRKPFGLMNAQDWKNAGGDGRIAVGGGFWVWTTDPNRRLIHDAVFYNVELIAHIADEGFDPNRHQAVAFCDMASSYLGKSKILRQKGAHHYNPPGKPVDEWKIRPLIYSGSAPTQRRINIRARQISGDSFVHYTDAEGDSTDKFTEHLGYGYSWIQGVYYCPFDTGDRVNFKLTHLPAFDSEEITEKRPFLFEGKIDVYLMPRRWAYYTRFRELIVTDEQVVTNYSFTDNAVPAAWWGFNYYDDDPDRYRQTHHAHFHSACCHVVKFHPADEDQAASGYMRSRVFESNYYLGFFWGRPPSWFQLRLLTTDLMPRYTIFGSNYNYDKRHKFRYYYNADDAAAMHTLAGASEKERRFIYAGGGLGDFHLHSDRTATLHHFGNGRVECPGDRWIGAEGSFYITGISSSAVGGPLHSTYNDTEHFWTLGAYKYDSMGISGLERRAGPLALFYYIRESALWTAHIGPKFSSAWGDADKRGSRLDCIPYGVAVSPSVKGSLVGIVRQRGKTYFVWRKTDEELEPIVSGLMPAFPEGPISFESHEADSRTRFFGEMGRHWHTNYPGDKGSIAGMYDYDYVDQFWGAGGRRLTHVGRRTKPLLVSPIFHEHGGCVLTTFVGDGPGQVKLDAPLYVMLSREYCSPDTYDFFYNSADDVLIFDKGVNYSLADRAARGVSANVSFPGVGGGLDTCIPFTPYPDSKLRPEVAAARREGHMQWRTYY